MPQIKAPAVQIEPKELLIKFQEALVDPKVQEFLFLKKQVDKALPSIKKSIGNEMLQNNEKKRNIGDNIEINTVAVTKPKLIDETLVPEDYYTTEELNQDNIIVEDGKAETVCHFCNEHYDFSKEELIAKARVWELQGRFYENT